MKKIVIIFIIIFIAGPYVSGAEKNTIAVLPLEARDVSMFEASLVTEHIRDGVRGTGRVRVLDRKSIEEALLAVEFDFSECTTPACAVKAGKLLNVGQVAVGNLSRLEGKYYISVKMVNVSDGSILSAESRECATAEGFKETAGLIGRRLMGISPMQAGGVPGLSEKVRLNRILTILNIEEKYYKREIRNSWIVAGFGLFLSINGLVLFRGNDRIIFEALGGGLMAIGAVSLGGDYGRLRDIRKDINFTLIKIGIDFR